MGDGGPDLRNAGGRGQWAAVVAVRACVSQVLYVGASLTQCQAIEILNQRCD